MKVVLFCGGRGIRLRRFGSDQPKPMVRIGSRPILWHVLKYYAHFGHTDFILCLGYRADVIKRYFLSYVEALSNDFTITGGERVELHGRDIQNWRITFVDTGLNANIGQRLRAVRRLVDKEEMFLANYADGLTDLHLPTMVDAFSNSSAVASFLCVRPVQSFHVVRLGEGDRVEAIEPMSDQVWINGGYFVMRPSIFDVLNEGDELVLAPFSRLIQRNQLMAYKYNGFWISMDTFKDKQMLEGMYAEGKAVWQVWRNGPKT